MTIWAIRDKAHFRVQWSTNDNWSYDSYLIRWDRDGQNIGQRDISGTVSGWWDFDFDTPGRYTFIYVEGVAAETTTMGGRFPLAAPSRRDIRRPTYPPEEPLPPALPPTISTETTLKVGERGQFLSLRSGSYPTRLLRRALADDVFLHERNFNRLTTVGGLKMRISLPVIVDYHFMFRLPTHLAPGMAGALQQQSPRAA